jgi:hypothetical protein
MRIQSVHGVAAADNEKQPLARVVPQLDELCADPQSFLANREVVIASAPYWVMYVMFSIVIFFGTFVGLSILAKSIVDQGADGPKPLGIWFAVLMLICVSIFTFQIVSRLFPRRSIILRSDGVRFTERRRAVHCPWALFQGNGRMYSTKEARILMPIDTTVVDRVEQQNSGVAKAFGWSIQTRFFWLKPRLYSAPPINARERLARWVWKEVTGVPTEVGNHAGFLDTYQADGWQIGILLRQLAAAMESTPVKSAASEQITSAPVAQSSGAVP